MKAKRLRDKLRDQADEEQRAIDSGEQTDWQQAMKEWNEWEENEKKTEQMQN